MGLTGFNRARREAEEKQKAEAAKKAVPVHAEPEQASPVAEPEHDKGGRSKKTSAK